MGLTNNLGKLSNMITSTGSAVGIAQASPAFTLDVSGTLRNTTSAYFATASGNVGIGTTTATNKLTITNDGNAANALRINDTNANASFLSLSASNTDAAIIANGTAAIPLDIYTGGSARVRVSATGNVGIGTTNPSYKLVVSNNGADGLEIIPGTNTSGVVNLLAFNRSGGTYSDMRFDGNNLIFYTNGVGERMRITSGGNVGIGTTSPSALLSVLSADNTSATNIARFAANNNTLAIGIGYESIRQTETGGVIKFETNATERMRITSGGDVTIGTTPTANGHNFFMASGNGAYQTIGHPNGTSTGYSYTIYYYNSGAIGGVSQSGTTAVVYNTTSDYRLKEVISPIQNSIDKILKLKPIHFKWKNTEDEYGDGFLAHELQEIIPLAVTGEKDALNEDGTYKLQQVDHSKLVPVLVKAIQEQNQLITSLQDRLDKAGL